MLNKVIVLFIVFVTLFVGGFSVCLDSALIESAEFSIGDNTFSSDYDGSSGVIQKIWLNDSTSEYELWQTPFLPYETTYPWGSTMLNYHEYPGNVLPFILASSFDSKKNRMLVINPSSNNFDFYYRITLRNSGDCNYNNNAWVGTYGDKSIRYYGLNTFDSYKLVTHSDPNTWHFTNVPKGGTKTKTYRIQASSINYYGRLMVRIGPEDIRDSNPEYQKINAYFWVDGTIPVCGNGAQEIGEVCDDGNTANGDYCSSDCRVRTSICGDGVNNYHPYLFTGFRGTTKIDNRWINYKEDASMTNYNDYYETCDTGIATSYICNSCESRSAVCGDGDVHYKYAKYNGYDESGSDRWNFYSYINPERCDTGATNSFICDSCTDRIATCGDGIVHYEYSLNKGAGQTDTFKYTGWEVCDTGQVTTYNCRADCRERLSVCGNGIVEDDYVINGDTRYYNPREQCDGGPGCTATCQLAGFCGDGTCGSGENESLCGRDCFTEPIIQYLNYPDRFNNRSISFGRNAVPGSNITFEYRITNLDPVPKKFWVYNKLYRQPWTSAVYGGTNALRYHASSLTETYDYSHYQFYNYTIIPPFSSVDINHTVVLKNTTDEDYKKVIERFSLYEQFRYRQDVPDTTGGPSLIPSAYPDSRRGAWNGFFAAYNFQYCIADLEPVSGSTSITVTEDGLPAAVVRYSGGFVRSSWLRTIPANKFFLKTRLIKDADGSTISQINHSIDRTYSYSSGIMPDNRDKVSQVAVTEDIYVPFYNYQEINNQLIRFHVVPFVNWSDYGYLDSRCDIRTNVYDSGEKTAHTLDLLPYNVDKPIHIYPNGVQGFDTAFSRMLLFNYEDYSLFNVSFNVSVRDSFGADVTGNFDINFKNTDIVPAGSAFPIGFETRYIGASPVFNSDYFANVTFTYYSAVNNTYESFSKEFSIRVYAAGAVSKFRDLIPIELNFTFLNVMNQTNITVRVANQGTLTVDNAKVKLYARHMNESTFTVVGEETVSGLNPGTIREAKFFYVPSSLEDLILKAVVDEDDSVVEDDTYSVNAERNNIITSIATVREIDVELVYAEPLYNNASNGIIPFKVFVRNKGVGGIDMYELDLEVTWDYYQRVDTFKFYQIPAAGKEMIFYWNVTEIPPRIYAYDATIDTLFDFNIADNTVLGVVQFCPLPWGSSIFDCYSDCSSDCLFSDTNRYDADCDGINSCSFYNETFAENCDGYTAGSYATFNSTHEALCPSGVVTRDKVFSSELINISSTDECSNIIIEKYFQTLDGKSVVMNVVQCVR